jgi:hypothetical protein
MSATAVRHHGEGDYRGVVRDILVVEGIVTKRATAGRAKLLSEVAWLRDLPPELQPYFPRVLGTRIGSAWAEYDMPYVSWPNFAELLVSGQICVSDAIAATQAILRLAFEGLYPRDNRPTPANFFHDNYVQKFELRASAVAGTFPRFDRLMREPVLAVNGDPVPNPRTLIQQIACDDELMAYLTPPHVGMVHGDFKFDNFLIELGTSRFLLLDPRGATFSGESAGDYLEDIAKLRTSSIGQYDLVRAGRAEIEVHGARIVCRLAPSATRTAELLAAIDAALLGWMPAWAEQRDDPHWRLRLTFLTPLLLLANAPFQLTPDSEDTDAVAIALLATGVRLLQAALNAYRARRRQDRSDPA